MTTPQKMLELADEIEAQTVPIPMDLVLLKDERAMIVHALCFTARSSAPAASAPDATGEVRERIARCLVANDPNYNTLHMPGDASRKWSSGGATFDTVPLNEKEAEKVRVRADAILAPPPPHAPGDGYNPAFVEEIKRADAAPPEASFSGAEEMLQHLNAPADASGADETKADVQQQIQYFEDRADAFAKAHAGIAADASGAGGLREALEAIANHPEKQDEGHSTYSVGWAFWNVQRIAKAALAALPDQRASIVTRPHRGSDGSEAAGN